MAFQLLLVISGVESPTQATEDSKQFTKMQNMVLFKQVGCLNEFEESFRDNTVIHPEKVPE